MAKIWCWLFGHNWQEGHMPSYRFFCSRCGGLGNITYAQQSVEPTRDGLGVFANSLMPKQSDLPK